MDRTIHRVRSPLRPAHHVFGRPPRLSANQEKDMIPDDDSGDSFFRGIGRDGGVQRACANVLITIVAAIAKQALSSRSDE